MEQIAHFRKGAQIATVMNLILRKRGLLIWKVICNRYLGAYFATKRHCHLMINSLQKFDSSINIIGRKN